MKPGFEAILFACGTLNVLALLALVQLARGRRRPGNRAATVGSLFDTAAPKAVTARGLSVELDDLVAEAERGDGASATLGRRRPILAAGGEMPPRAVSAHRGGGSK